ncbi:MAG: pyridoxamine 5'-phosphate oxidase family protein [Paracoccaceae bacterium]
MLDRPTPFHTGELAAQKQAGAGDIATRAAPFIRDFLPEQHRAFYQAQPFLVVASDDGAGRVWTTIVEGKDGFIGSPDATSLTLDTAIDTHDPLAQSLIEGADIGVVGIELATRRRNRFSGRTRGTDGGIAIDIRQTFGNCPQYISERDWWRAERGALDPVTSDHLSPEQIARIGAADTLFIGSGRQGAAASDGYDASHRGGAPGFVRVARPNVLRIPDYSGNNFFNTIGNLLEDPRVGLLFVDFTSGGLLHVTGRARIDWTPEEARDPSVLRVIEVEVDGVIDRPGALSLRWSAKPTPSRAMRVRDKVVEAEGITSFYLSPVDGGPLPPFQPGQHLPIALDIPTHDTKVRRTYSLSGPVADAYRITVKREDAGVASRFLHDVVAVGDVIEAKPPAGDFLIPDGDGPLVLISAGVGLTPMVAMLHHVVARGDRPVWFLHGARDGRHHALREEVDRLISAGPNAKRRVYYSAPGDADVMGEDFDVQGRVSAADVLALEPGPEAQYVLCGPLGFISDLTSGLSDTGVPKSRVHFETFGS